jgi:hypothetical protein
MPAEWYEQLQSVLPETAPPAPSLSLGGVPAQPSTLKAPQEASIAPSNEGSDLSPCFEDDHEEVDGIYPRSVAFSFGEEEPVGSVEPGQVEGVSVILERHLPMGSILPKAAPPLPREDPAPEPVTRRGQGHRDANGKFRRNPAVI